MHWNAEGGISMPDMPVVDTRDMQLIQLVRTHTNLADDDIRILLEVSHSLPFIGNLESGDTYVNVLTQKGESMVVAQYRHPQCDLYKRDIIGEIERKEDEPAVYRALEYGTSSRGLIGIIDEGRIVVRHTVSPIFNAEEKVVGSLTYEYLNTSTLAETIRVLNKEGKDNPLERQINKVIGRLQDGFLVYDDNGICIFANAKAEEFYQGAGFETGIIGRSYEELQLTKESLRELLEKGKTVKSDVCLGQYILEETLSPVREEKEGDGLSQGIVVILQDKTKTRQLEDEIAYQNALIHEVHHRVKNNLQTIISLVGLEAAQTKNEEIKAFARTITSRIRSISVTYDLLAHSETENVELQTMLVRLARDWMENKNVGECKVQVEICGDSLELAANTASTVSLIINELIQNSMKYAFPNRDTGMIWLTVERGNKSSWITVRDDGCGVDEKRRNSPGGGLGLQLVRSLVRSSLKGEIDFSSSSKGTVVRFSVQNPEHAARRT